MESVNPRRELPPTFRWFIALFLLGCIIVLFGNTVLFWVLVIVGGIFTLIGWKMPHAFITRTAGGLCFIGLVGLFFQSQGLV
jgi:hypothetical protein